MQNIIIDKPYSFIAPHKSAFWPRALQLLLPLYLRHKYGIESIEFHGLDHLQASLANGCAIALTPNHCRPCDPPVMAMLSRALYELDARGLPNSAALPSLLVRDSRDPARLPLAAQ